MGLINAIGSLFDKFPTGFSFGDNTRKLTVKDNIVIELETTGSITNTYEYTFPDQSGVVSLVSPRVNSTASTSTITVNSDTTDIYLVTALAEGTTIAAPTGTPSQGQKLTIRIKDNGTSRTIGYNAIFRAFGTTLPTSTTVSKTLYLGMIYNSTDTKWDVVAISLEN